MKSLLNKKKMYLYLAIFFIISILSIYKASIYLSKSLGVLYIKQIYWYLIGTVLILIVKRLNIIKLYNYSFLIYLICIFLLSGLFLFGIEINNTKAWYKIFNISIQPSEFMKISLILLNSYVINKFYKNRSKIKTKQEFKLILLLFLITLIPSILTFLEPDTGAIISYIIITIGMLYIAGINKKWFYLLLLIITCILSFFLITYYSNETILTSLIGESSMYRIERIINWQNKEGMQLNNSLTSIGISGLFGNKKVPIYYPEAGTDFIFTSFSSSYGLIGSLFLIITIILFNFHIIKVIKKTKRKQDKYTLFGILVLFSYQQIQNIAMSIGLLPITGITLPLISYGGSSLLTYLILIGIVLNIEKKA